MALHDEWELVRKRGSRTMKHIWLAITLVAAAFTAGNQFFAKAEGAPALDPLFYAGSLEVNGVPASGDFAIALEFCDAERDGHSLCTSEAEAARVERGRFRIPVRPDCVEILRANADVWI